MLRADIGDGTGPIQGTPQELAVPRAGIIGAIACDPSINDTVWLIFTDYGFGKGAWRDNRMIERLWRSVKYEDVYLRSYEDGQALGAGPSRWIEHYNRRRPHQHLGGATPEKVYRAKGGQAPERQAA